MAVRPPEGYSGNLTDDQKAALTQFKENLSSFVKEKGGMPGDASAGYSSATPGPLADPKGPIEPGTAEEEISEANMLLASEVDMLRFLRARQCDVDRATEMAVASIKWRASVKPWAIVPENIPEALPSGVWRWAGYTKSGMPILHVDCENWKPSQYYGVEEYIRYLGYVLEGAVGRMGEGVQRVFVIYWIPKLNMEMMKPRAMECAQTLMKVMQDQFPERLGAAVVCNAPAMFSAMWKAVQGWIDPVTKAKFQIAPRGQATETLLKYIDADVLPKSLGGQHEEYPLPTRPVSEEIADAIKNFPPPAASNVSAVMGCTDETIMSGSLGGSYEGLITIRPGTTYSLQVHLEENTKRISWNFDEPKKREINFGYKVTGAVAPAPTMFSASMFANPAASQLAAKAATMLMNQDPTPVDFSQKACGSVDVQKTWAGGTLNLLFDNSAARFFSANIAYGLVIEAE